MNLQKANKNIFLFYLLSFITNAWFISSNWIYFWTKFMTFGQLGWVDGISFGFALLLDIPTGALADIFGKKKTIIFSMIVNFIGIAIIATAHTLPTIFIGWMITQVGFACYSGTADALAYDTLVEAKRENEYDKVISKSHAIEMYATALTTFIGGFLYVTNFRLPHLLWAGAYVIGFIISLYLIEPHVERVKFSFLNYLRQLSVGIKELLKPMLRIYVLYFLVLLGFYYMFAWGFIRPAMFTSFGFYAKEQGIILPIMTLLFALTIGIVPWLRKHCSDIVGLTLLSLSMSIGFFASSFPIGYYGLFAIFFVYVGGKLAYPWISIIVNKEIPSKYRVTTLSTMALITKIPYVFVAVLAGSAIEKGQLHTFTLDVSIFIILCVAITIGMYLYKKN